MDTHIHHRVQAGLPIETAVAWMELDDRFGAGLTAIYAWGDAAHRRRPSCHNTGRAIDLMTGVPRDHAAIVLYALAHRDRLRIRRIISTRHVWSAKSNWQRAEYTGSNPHLDHVHLSINCDL